MPKQTLKIFAAFCVLAGGGDTVMADGNTDLDSCAAAGRADDYAAVVKYCTSALDSKDLTAENEATALQNRGLAYTYLGKLDEAITDFGRGIALNSKNASLFAGRGWALQQKHAIAESMADLDQALTLDPDNVSALTNRALAFVAAGRYDEAIRDSSRAIAIAPNVSAAYGNRANAYKNLGKFKEAMADYDRAVALDPKQAMVYNDRGTAYGEQRRFDLALADFNRALELDPGVAIFFFNRGLNYLKMKQEDQAVADFNAALARDQELAWAHKDLGDILGKQGNANEALAHFDAAIRLQPNEAAFYRGRAMALLSAGDYAHTIDDAGRALVLDPKLYAALGIKGFAQFLSSDFAGAASTFEFDLRRGSQSPYAMIYWYLARQRAHEDGGTTLTAYLGKANLSQWPGPLLGHLQGYVSEAEMLKAANAGAPPAVTAQTCQARFALGEIALMLADTETAARHFEQAVTVCPKSLLDYYGAKAELERLK